MKAGDCIGNYLIEERLGSGAQSDVYLARDTVLRRAVALKVLTNRENHAVLLEEARLIAALDHPNILRLFHIQLQGKFWYMAMEYVDGGTLESVVHRRGSLPPKEALRLGKAACDAVRYAHQHGVLHRDIKPQNLLVSRLNVIKLADFGLAKVGGSEQGGLVGTPKWVAPEIWQGSPATALSDVYSLGATFFAMLTGRAPFEEESMEAYKEAHLTRRPELPPNISAPVARLVESCLEKKPSNRPTSTELYGQFLELELGSEGADDHFAGKRTSGRPRRRNTLRAEKAVNELRPILEIQARLRHCLRHNTLSILQSAPFDWSSPCIRQVFEEARDDFFVAAQIVFSPGSGHVLDILARRLGVSKTSDQVGAIIEACVGSHTLERTRSVVCVQLHRRVRDAEVERLVELAVRGKERRLSVLVACDAEGAAAFVERTDPKTREAFSLIKGRRPTADECKEFLSNWTQAATDERLIWTDDACRLAISVSEQGDLLPRIAHNACTIAEAMNQRVVTTWCVTEAVNHQKMLPIFTEGVAIELSTKPKRIPSESFIRVLLRLRGQD